MIGIGVDITNIERFNQSKEQTTRLAKRILTDVENEEFQTRSLKNETLGIHYLAKRFCAKEAVSKALGTGIANGVSFKDIEIFNNPLGAPQVKLSGQALSIFEQKNANQILISLSDEKAHAIAYVTIC